VYGKWGQTDRLWDAQRDSNPYANSSQLLLPDSSCIVSGYNGRCVNQG